MKRPTVGYAMSLYNQSDWVIEAIESALQQTVSPDQIVVVDDGSTDNSRELVKSIRSSKIKLVEVQRRGVSSVLNTAVAHLDTDYVAIQACDDVSISDRIERQLEAIAKTSARSVFGLPRIIDEHSDVMPDEHAPEFFPSVEKSESVLRHFFFFGNYLCASSALLDRGSFLRCGGFHPGLLHLQDFNLWIKFASESEPAVLEERVVKYRRTSFGGNLSSEVNDKRMRAEFSYVFHHFFDSCSFARLFEAFPEIEDAHSEDEAHIQLLLQHQDHLVYQAGVELLLSTIQRHANQPVVLDRRELTSNEIFEIVGKSDVDRRDHLNQIASQLKGVAPWLLND